MRGMRRWMWLGLLGGVGLTGCGEEPRTYEVAPYMVPCYGVGPWLCMQVKEAGSDQQQLFYDGISGFSFQWGVTQTITVRVHDVANPPQDGSSEEWVLERVVTRAPVLAGERFQLALTGEFIQGDQVSGLSLLSSPRITCADEALCQELAQSVGGTRRFTVEFSYPSGPEQPLVAERLVPVP